MSRLYTRNSRGRQPMLGSTIKFSKSSREHQNDTYQPNGKKSKPVRKYAITKTSVGKRKRADTPASVESSSSFGGFDSADDASDENSEEDADEEDDLPAVKAPSRSHILNGAGRTSQSIPDNVSVAGSDSMFGDFDTYFEDDEDPNFSPEENRKKFEEKVFADSDEDDNDVYQAVDDISDSEDDVDELRIQQQELLSMRPEEELSDTDFLNQIDGLSAYGFGDDSDGSIYRFPSSQSSDSATEAVAERHVHFAADADPTLFMRMSESPTITRALLPSALPDIGFSHYGADSRAGGLVDDLDDSDLTDDCLPEEALQTTPRHVEEAGREPSPPPSPRTKKSAKKPARRKGPPRGIFIDDGDKTSGILDSSGKIILMTNPHLLGEEFARRYGASQTSSPDVGFAELIEESDAGERELADPMVGPTPDIMLASLNSVANGPLSQGQAIGPLEAFYPSTGFMFDDDLVDVFQGDELGEDVIDLADVIRFDSDSEDSDGLTSPLSLPRNGNFLSNDFAHLNSGNVTAFRRNADPAMSRLPPHLDINLTSSPLATPAPRRRKKIHSSPYTSSHYKGVTPVQRMRDPNNGRTPNAATPAKKRRLMT